MYLLRAIGGLLYVIGIVLMAVQPLPDRQERAVRARTGGAGARAAQAARTPDTRPDWAIAGSKASRCIFTVLTIVAVLIGGLVEIVPLFLIKSNVPDHLQRETLHAARSAGTRHLHPRRLRRLPFADGPAVPLRDRALRRILQGRRIRLRSSVPLGLEAHRPGPASRRRQVSAMPGITTTWRIRAPRRPARSCRATRGC